MANVYLMSMCGHEAKKNEELDLCISHFEDCEVING